MAASEQSTSGISDFYSGWRSAASDDLSLGITALCHLKHWANSSAHLEEKSLSLFLYLSNLVALMDVLASKESLL